MDSWGWAIAIAGAAALTVMLLMALYDEISRRKWLANSGAESWFTSRPHCTKSYAERACAVSAWQ